MVKNKPLLRFIANDDKVNLYVPLKQENEIISREQLLAEQHTYHNIIEFCKRYLQPEGHQSRRMFLFM